ncbi:hypothetical protein [Natranaerobius thermophilus]|uniref:Uncharacterized protein n=1 Tax=Natranaerobius thermophilus (strain ATCC BAA-1301 / DSM 18059 / JW/NM-WN-LF) TaxID=457570 RepID=B2A0V8_NATTJ|nr:hypothetical protein [Natranaerobius thermophilus]ACB85988.1 hypothetical protein Nther_2423 [Natranaerobius thermophilus JW/NM-WN-LF]
MLLKDRLIRGFIAGVIASIFANIPGYILYSLGTTSMRFVDWAALFIYGTHAQNFLEMIVAQVGQIIFSGILGIIFAYLIPYITSIGNLFKGWLYGVGSWFFIYAFTILFDLEQTYPIRFGTAFSNFIGASIYGLILAAVLKWLDNKVSIK